MGVICVSDLLSGIGNISFLEKALYRTVGSEFLHHYGFTTVWVNGFGGLSLQPNKHYIVDYRKTQPRF